MADPSRHAALLREGLSARIHGTESPRAGFRGAPQTWGAEAHGTVAPCRAASGVSARVKPL
jgi:hypothetical protein